MHPKLFEYFKIANAGEYMAKAEFYRLKEILLLNEAIQDGYDLQILEYTCKSCNGKGSYQSSKKIGRKIQVHPIIHCIDCQGTGKIKHFFYLHRYLLNDKIFHLAHRAAPANMELKDTIISKIIHEPVPISESYKALLILILFYEPERIDKINYYRGMMEYLSKNLESIKSEVKEIRSETSPLPLSLKKGEGINVNDIENKMTFVETNY